MMELFKVVKKSDNTIMQVANNKMNAKVMRDGYNNTAGFEAFKVTWGKDHWRSQSEGHHMPHKF